MNTFGWIVFVVVMLHLLLGFGYALYKITAKPKNESEQDPEIKKGPN